MVIGMDKDSSEVRMYGVRLVKIDWAAGDGHHLMALRVEGVDDGALQMLEQTLEAYEASLRELSNQCPDDFPKGMYYGRAEEVASFRRFLSGEGLLPSRYSEPEDME